MTKSQLKYFQSLSLSKNRKQEQCFLVEGDKSAQEWILDGRFVLNVIATRNWLDNHADLLVAHRDKCLEAEQFEIDKISALKTPTQVVVIAKLPVTESSVPFDKSSWSLALDAVRDPGNMGTIIRTADWFGISTIYVSKDCVDVYNPKVVQASMGSLLRVAVVVCDNLFETLRSAQVPVYTTHLKGQDIRTVESVEKGIILMGNESKGVDEVFLSVSTALLFVPRMGGAESLNVAVATGIVCSQLILK